MPKPRIQVIEPTLYEWLFNKNIEKVLEKKRWENLEDNPAMRFVPDTPSIDDPLRKAVLRSYPLSAAHIMFNEMRPHGVETEGEVAVCSQLVKSLDIAFYVELYQAMLDNALEKFASITPDTVSDLADDRKGELIDLLIQEFRRRKANGMPKSKGEKPKIGSKLDLEKILEAHSYIPTHSELYSLQSLIAEEDSNEANADTNFRGAYSRYRNRREGIAARWSAVIVELEGYIELL